MTVPDDHGSASDRHPGSGDAYGPTRGDPHLSAAKKGTCSGRLRRGSWPRASSAELQPTEGDRPNVLAWVRNGDGPTLLPQRPCGHGPRRRRVVRRPVAGAAGGRPALWPRRVRHESGRRRGDAGDARPRSAPRRLARHVLFTSVVDDEAYSIGARAWWMWASRRTPASSRRRRDLNVVLGCIGKVLVRGEVMGKAAHASWPERGINAAVEAGEVRCARLTTVPLGQHPRLEASQCVLSLHERQRAVRDHRAGAGALHDQPAHRPRRDGARACWTGCAPSRPRSHSPAHVRVLHRPALLPAVGDRAGPSVRPRPSRAPSRGDGRSRHDALQPAASRTPTTSPPISASRP